MCPPPRPPSPPCHRPQPCPLWLMRWNEYRSPCTPRHTTNTVPPSSGQQQLPTTGHLPCARRPAECSLSTASFSVTLRNTLRAVTGPHVKDRRPERSDACSRSQREGRQDSNSHQADSKADALGHRQVFLKCFGGQLHPSLEE